MRMSRREREFHRQRGAEIRAHLAREAERRRRREPEQLDLPGTSPGSIETPVRRGERATASARHE